MFKLKHVSLLKGQKEFALLPSGKVLINTINAHSYNTAQKDALFAEALLKGDYLIPDGASIVKACHWLKAKSQPEERIAGWDLFEFEMGLLNERGGRCFFLGSSERVLDCSFTDCCAASSSGAFWLRDPAHACGYADSAA